MPVFGSKIHEALTGSPRANTSPLSASVGFAFPARTRSPHAACAEPGPWHASQETSISEKVVA